MCNGVKLQSHLDRIYLAWCNKANLGFRGMGSLISEMVNESSRNHDRSIMIMMIIIIIINTPVEYFM